MYQFRVSSLVFGLVLLFTILLQALLGMELSKFLLPISAICLSIGLGAIRKLEGFQYTAWIIAAVVCGMTYPALFLGAGVVDLRNRWAHADFGQDAAQLAAEQRAALETRLQLELRANPYDPQTGVLVISRDRAAAARSVADYYARLFGDDPDLRETREAYAMREETVAGAQRREDLTAFFFWAAWACVTQRPGSDVTYSNNWPPDAWWATDPPAA